MVRLLSNISLERVGRPPSQFHNNVIGAPFYREVSSSSYAETMGFERFCIEPRALKTFFKNGRNLLSRNGGGINVTERGATARYSFTALTGQGP